jgi:hypothetical protein
VISFCPVPTNIFISLQNNVSCFILSPFLVLSEHYPISFDQKPGQQLHLSTYLSALARTINPPMPLSYQDLPISILSSKLLYTFFLFSSYRFPSSFISRCRIFTYSSHTASPTPSSPLENHPPPSKLSEQPPTSYTPIAHPRIPNEVEKGCGNTRSTQTGSKETKDYLALVSATVYYLGYAEQFKMLL